MKIKINCPGCPKEFEGEVTGEDINITDDGKAWVDMGIKCPVCKTETWISAKSEKLKFNLSNMFDKDERE